MSRFWWIGFVLSIDMITDILTIAADIVTIKEYTRQLLHGETSRTENRTDHDRSVVQLPIPLSELTSDMQLEVVGVPLTSASSHITSGICFQIYLCSKKVYTLYTSKTIRLRAR